MSKPLSNICVAITRPTGQAKKLTQLIQDAGGTIIAFPLIEIAPLADLTAFKNMIADISLIDWVIFISSNAVQNGMPTMVKLGIPSHLKFAAIGPITAQELKVYGVQKVLTPESRFDSESLLTLPEMQDVSGKKIMIVRGVGGREILADTLKSRGAEVVFAECYQRINPQTSCEVLDTAWQNQRLHAIVVTSSDAMRHLLDLASEASWLKQINIYVNHARVAETAQQQGLSVKVSESVGDEQMLAIILNSKCA
jgi:uroporphyrinogen-III synthase